MDWTFTAGDAIELLGMLGAVAALYARISARLAVIESKLDVLWSDFRGSKGAGVGR